MTSCTPWWPCNRGPQNHLPETQRSMTSRKSYAGICPERRSGQVQFRSSSKRIVQASLHVGYYPRSWRKSLGKTFGAKTSLLLVRHEDREVYDQSARVAQSCTTTTDCHFGPVVMISKSAPPFLALAVRGHKPEGFSHPLGIFFD